MKNSIIYLGIALITFTNANSMSTEKLQSIQDMNFEITKEESVVQDNSFFRKELLSNDSESIIVKTFPKPSIESENVNSNLEDMEFIVKPIEEVIAENSQIIECSIDKVLRPLNLEIPIENSIEEDNKIIEGNLSNVVYPLDFDIINRSVFPIFPIYKEEFRTH